jgi:hypothetical protein
MKKIINNKVYDTDTAMLVARADHDNIKDATGNTCKQALYRKKTGELFVHLESGTSLTLHSVLQSDYRQGRGIYPLTYEQAKKWAEDELSADIWEHIFGESDEDVALNLIISAAASAKLKKAAAQNGISLRAQLERWILEAK